jgi:hypothetical protein
MKIEALFISDVHLGSKGSCAAQLLEVLKTYEPKNLFIVGDFIDGWILKKRHYWCNEYNSVIRKIMQLSQRGTRVVYITGNHDDLLRKYTDLQLGNLQIVDKYFLELDKRKAWIFHGDVFDNTTKGSAKLLAKLGGKGYDWLILINRMMNWCLEKLGKEKVSFSKKIKDSVKKAVSWINNFETTAAELAIEKKFDFVICGHIHKPQNRIITTEKGSVQYLNSGDWVENLTALEFNEGEWKIYHYEENEMQNNSTEKEEENEMDFLTKILAS